MIAQIKFVSRVGIAVFYAILTFSVFPADDTATRHLGITIEGAINYGPLDGYTQVPAGGRPGSSSLRRPSFDEIGVKNRAFSDLSLQFDWPHLQVYFDSRILRPGASNELLQDLVTRNIRIPSGSLIRGRTRFDTMSLGISRSFQIPRTRTTLFPLVEFSLLKFLYEPTVEGIDLSGAKRRFNSGGLRFGLAAERQITDRIALEGTLVSTIPGLSNLQMTDTHLRAKFRFNNIDSGSSTIFLGIGYQRIKFKDSQELPNDLELKIFPVTTIGYSYSF